ncbi:MAG: hypothetical protein WBZ42_00635 [Halobacteriota archaeon]
MQAPPDGLDFSEKPLGARTKNPLKVDQYRLLGFAVGCGAGYGIPALSRRPKGATPV